MDVRDAMVITEEDGQHEATAPDAPNVFVVGETADDAAGRLREAVCIYLAEMSPMGEDAPRPRARVGRLLDVG